MITPKEYECLLEAQIILIKAMGHWSLTIEDILWNPQCYMDKKDIKKLGIKPLASDEHLKDVKL